MTIENPGNLGFGTWEKPGKIPGKYLVKTCISLASQTNLGFTDPWPSPSKEENSATCVAPMGRVGRGVGPLDGAQVTGAAEGAAPTVVCDVPE